MGHLSVLLFLLGALGALAERCEMPQVNSKLVEMLGQRLLPWMDRLSLEELNPSIYVGLRLSSLQAEAKEALYLHSLKVHYQQSLLGSATSDGEDIGDVQVKPTMGQLALYLLALRANWHTHKGQPHTSYYQYGLAILALCVHQKRVHDRVVGKLLYAVEHDQPVHRGHLSVDTAAIAGLAFTCLKRTDLNPEQRERLTLAITTVKEKILNAQTPEGYFGNIYSTPLALQMLMTSSMPNVRLSLVCHKARDALLTSLQGRGFQNVLMLSQLLPVLNHKSYVDLIFPDCLAPRAILEPATETPPQPHVSEAILVGLKVSSFSPPYKYSVPVTAGASLEDVLKEAQGQGFTFGTQASLSGPYLTSVMGKEAGEREFWQLLQENDTPLLQGIADYIPKDGETIELRLVTW
ncbi:PREDICTED: transcobalamin-2 isoform X2 [Elephantulus edwardii]|uniref:transcobalamin-2 isoform X2 n=1 Tax=Elephantulus edwardii TaxID=28737 RepID=UPI0003F068CE|nr:PREDICTED: transcobalamin-2 isoform X2 [Elephantulus edwardii]